MLGTVLLKRPSELRSFRRRLASWYQANRRALPWRKTRDPYRIWVSEIMLQQTRVAAVLEYYRLFLQRFPTVHHLVAASEAEVLAVWSGLGYYRRARMLHKAARVVVAEHDGRLPRTSSLLRKLPGIGRYTGNAIASIAFGEPVAAVDGNVERVLSRMGQSMLAGDALWNAAQGLLDPTAPGDFNQAMMELGATVCTPKKPSCRACPVMKYCASKSGIALSLTPPEKRVQRSASLLLRRRAGKILLSRRANYGTLMPGMWELPQLATAGAASPILKVRHSITITNWRVDVFPSGEAMPNQHLRWIAASQAETLPLTGLTRKILRKLNIIA